MRPQQKRSPCPRNGRGNGQPSKRGGVKINFNNNTICFFKVVKEINERHTVNFTRLVLFALPIYKVSTPDLLLSVVARKVFHFCMCAPEPPTGTGAGIARKDVVRSTRGRVPPEIRPARTWIGAQKHECRLDRDGHSLDGRGAPCSRSLCATRLRYYQMSRLIAHERPPDDLGGPFSGAFLALQGI